jgi:hypothetical protein
MKTEEFQLRKMGGRGMEMETGETPCPTFEPANFNLGSNVGPGLTRPRNIKANQSKSKQIKPKNEKNELRPGTTWQQIKANQS